MRGINHLPCIVLEDHRAAFRTFETLAIEDERLGVGFQRFLHYRANVGAMRIACLLNFAGLGFVPRRDMFESIGKPNLVTLLTLGLVSAVLPKLLPAMGPAVGTSIKVVIDLLTESEAEAAEELMEALVSSTIAEINRQVSRPADQQQSRQAIERTMAHFKRRARRRAHSWGADEHDRRRRYGRHLRKLREAIDQSKDRHDGWRRDILDDLGDSLDEAA
jgi:hypothetical protein